MATRRSDRTKSSSPATPPRKAVPKPATKQTAKPKPLAKPAAAQAAKMAAKPKAMQQARNVGLLTPQQAEAKAVAAVGPAAIPATAAEATPRKLADERRRLEIRRKRERQNRIRVFEKADKELAESRTNVLALPASAAAPAALAAAAVQPLRILAEGDSWFDYPNFGGAGVIWQLKQKIDALFLNLAKAGDEARFMLGVDERKVLAEQLKAAVDRGRPFDALLFSGGGNDIVGNPLVLWLKTFQGGMSAQDVIDAPRFGSALGLVRAAYEDLIQIRDQNSPSTAIFLHGYDHAIPDGSNICGFGPWLLPSLKARGVPEPMRRAVIKELLTQFAALLATLADPAKKIFAVPTQGTLSGHDNWWHNELHPNADGFRAIADKFRTALKTEFPGRV